MLIIRDDDTSYWTQKSELENVYGPYLEQGFKISLAVSPYAYKTFYRNDRSKMYFEATKKYIYENSELVNYLAPYIKDGLIEIMLHGFDHSYCLKINNKYKFIDLSLRTQIGTDSSYPYIAECVYKNSRILSKELMLGRKILEDTFHVKVSTFVPPSNSLNMQSAKIVDQMGLDISGTIQRNFNRPINYLSINNYIKKGIWNIIYHNSYPFPMAYTNHKELVSHAFTPKTDLQIFQKQYEYCQKVGAAFTLATHYWELLESKSLLNNFNKFIVQNSISPKHVTCLYEIFK